MLAALTYLLCIEINTLELGLSMNQTMENKRVKNSLDFSLQIKSNRRLTERKCIGREQLTDVPDQPSAADTGSAVRERGGSRQSHVTMCRAAHVAAIAGAAPLGTNASKSPLQLSCPVALDPSFITISTKDGTERQRRIGTANCCAMTSHISNSYWISDGVLLKVLLPILQSINIDYS